MRVPFTILTGWLGAGKTTALNRMLAAQHGRRIAVLVNELGRISIDTQLIIGRGGDVLELAGGCVPGTTAQEDCGNCGKVTKTCTQYCAYTSGAWAHPWTVYVAASVHAELEGAVSAL